MHMEFGCRELIFVYERERAHECASMCAQVHGHSCDWQRKTLIGQHCQSLSTLFFKMETEAQPTRLCWMAKEPRGPAYFYLPPRWAYKHKDWPQVLMLAQQVLYPRSHLPGLLAMVFITVLCCFCKSCFPLFKILCLNPLTGHWY